MGPSCYKFSPELTSSSRDKRNRDSRKSQLGKKSRFVTDINYQAPLLSE